MQRLRETQPQQPHLSEKKVQRQSSPAGVRNGIECLPRRSRPDTGNLLSAEEIISSAVQRGQHICHAMMANHLPVSQSIVYRHADKGSYAIAIIDLPRAAKFRQRAKKGAVSAPDPFVSTNPMRIISSSWRNIPAYPALKWIP